MFNYFKWLWEKSARYPLLCGMCITYYRYWDFNQHNSLEKVKRVLNYYILITMYRIRGLGRLNG